MGHEPGWDVRPVMLQNEDDERKEPGPEPWSYPFLEKQNDLRDKSWSNFASYPSRFSPMAGITRQPQHSFPLCSSYLFTHLYECTHTHMHMYTHTHLSATFFLRFSVLTPEHLPRHVLPRVSNISN